MVKKTSKYNVHSGNTLKASGSRQTRRYAKQSCLVRQLYMDDTQDYAGEHDRVLTELTTEQNSLDGLMKMGTDDNGIVYSLNKKGRWLLPELIKAHIHSNASQDQDIKISILEHHKLKKQANCISFHSNKGEVTAMTAKKGYFSGQSVIGKGGSNVKRKRNKRKKAPDVSTDDETAEDFKPPVLPEIRYEVFYPSPNTSSITHNPKYITKRLATGTEEIADGKYKATKSKKRGMRMADVDIDRDYMDEYYEYDYEEDCDINEVSQYETDERLQDLTGESVLGLLLERALLARDLCNMSECSDASNDSDCIAEETVSSTNSNGDRYQYNPPIRYGKGTAIFAGDTDSREYREYAPRALEGKQKLDKSNTTARESRATAAIKMPRSMPTARIVLPSQQVTTAFLNDQFPLKYMECACQPRKFAIDISSDVYDICQRRHFIFKREELWSWLIFTYDGMYDDHLQVFRVSLNSELVLPSTGIETLFDMNVYTMEALINSVLMMVESCPMDLLCKGRSLVVRTVRPTIALDVLGSIKSWTRQTYRSDQAHKMTFYSFLQTKPDLVAEAAQAVVTDQGERPEYCNICFSLIKPSKLESVPSTCLQACQHWFCDVCWREHLMSNIARGSLRLLCPEYDCDKCLDHATALSLVSADDYKNHLHHHHDNKVKLESKMTKWCPNPKCGRILLAVNGGGEEAAGMCVTCDCGLSMCFNCLREAHWPANCEQAKKYNQKRKKLGDENAMVGLDEVTDMEIPVKYCPKCHEPINKYGGCPHVVCRCGHAFCWDCRSVWPHSGPCKNSRSDLTGTIRVVVRHEDRLKKHRDQRSRMYLMSLKHRQYRHPRTLGKFHKWEMKLKTSIKTQNVYNQMKQSPDLSLILSKYGAQEDDRSSIAKAVDKFISCITRLHAEIHFIVEHTAVLLEGFSLKAPRNLLLQLINRMDFLCTRIEQIFEDGPSHGLMPLMSRLQKLQTDARRCLTSLIFVITPLHIQNSSTCL